jgi:ABC-type enterochelin transport system permease subunit
MNDLKFDYWSTRSEKARVGVKLNQTELIILMAVVFLMLIFGVALIIIESPIGWAVIGLSAIPFMIVQWYKGELHHQVIAKNPVSIDDVLSSDILGRLSRTPTPREVAQILGSASVIVFYRILRQKIKTICRRFGKVHGVFAIKLVAKTYQPPY